jgi:DNA-binding NarL/FixJ family response regulator
MELAWAEGTEDTHAAIAHAGEAYELLDDPLRRTIAATIQARMLLFTRTAQEAAAVVQRAQRELPAGLDDLRFGLEAFELYTPSFGASVPDADARLAQVRERGALDGVGGRLLGAVAAWNWALTGGRAAECGDMAIEALSDGSLIRVDPRLGAPVAVAVLALAERDEVVAMGEAVLREGQRRGEPLTIGTANIWRGFAWLERGELAEAESVLRQAREMIGPLEENGAGLAYVAGLLARVLHEGGDAAGARSVLAAATPAARGSDGEALLRRSAIELRLESGAWEQALAEVEQYRGDLRGADNPAWAPWRSLKAQALDGLGRRDEAMALVEEELVHARHWGAPGTLARTLRLLGTLRDDQGLDLLHEAVACAARSPARLEHAKTLVDLGTALRRADRRDAAREPLREGFELASHCEARALAAHARTELYAAGGRPRRESLTEPGSLTPSERRIAELAAAGSRNRDIAQVLYVTPKTVEVHLTSIYRKLGISARAQLADALG